MSTDRFSKARLGADVALGAVLALLLLPAVASANAAAPTTYYVDVTGNTVTICPENFDERECPDEGGMLREDVESGEVVQLAQYCEADDRGSSCYVDECVPQGTYRYGFADPYACESASAGTDYYTEAEVTDPLPSGCERSADNAEPTAADGTPWTDSRSVCSYGGDAGPFGDGGYAADAGSGDGSGDGSGGCASAGVGSAQTVLLFNFAVALLGLLLWHRRRR